MTHPCPQCGATFTDGMTEGLCPACLLKQGAASATAPKHADARFVPPTPTVLGRCFPQLEILELLGQGGMGAVYKARQKELDRFVALKILPPDAGHDPGFAERFSREARVLAQLNHPNIVAIHDFGKTGEFCWVMMEYVDGLNLRQMLRARKIAPKEALAIVPQICDALQFAHNEGIVHRDIKPENILLDTKGRVKIADFGLAKILRPQPADFTLTDAGATMGTPHYMAPEQVEKPHDVDHRADIYSLGVVFYEMLTGELPLGKFAPPSRKIRVDVRLDEVVLHSLEKEPEHRYQHASEVKTMVETIVTSPFQTSAGGLPTETPPFGAILPWGRFIGGIFGITFTSPLTEKIANLSVIGFLCFLGFIPLPGWYRCFGFSGFFGLIGVAFLIEQVAHWKKGDFASRPTRVWSLLLAVFMLSGVTAIWLYGWARDPRAEQPPAPDPVIERAVRTIAQCAEGDPRVEEAMRSLRPLASSQVMTALIPYLDSTTDTIRRSAIYILWKGGVADIGPASTGLQKLLVHEEPFTRGMAALALGQNRIASSYDALAKMAKEDNSGYARRCAVSALGLLGDARGIPILQQALADRDPLVAHNARFALDRLNTLASKASTIGSNTPPSSTAVITRQVNKLVSEFPDLLDLSSPEAAGAAWQRACARKDAQAVSQLSWRPIDPRETEKMYHEREARDPEELAGYLKGLAESRILDVLIWHEELAAVIAYLPFPEGKGSDRYSSRILGRIDGQWKELGEDRQPSMDAARANFEQKKETLWRQFADLKKSLRNSPPTVLPNDYLKQKPPAPERAAVADKTGAAKKAAIATAEKWLALVDEDKYAEGWNEAAAYLRNAIGQDSFMQSLDGARKPLGKVISRVARDATYETQLPGAPDGEYVVIQFDTTFENKRTTVETITPMIEKDGQWRVSGYYIK